MPDSVLVVIIFCFGLAVACAPGRPAFSDRRFSSAAIETVIVDVASRMRDRELACIFSNSLPNTLDTTVFAHSPIGGENDTFIITGDIEAMWLRDSMNQPRAHGPWTLTGRGAMLRVLVIPYMPYASKDPALKALLRGLVRRQAAQITTDVPSFLGTRVAAMTPLIFERKYELDSLCAFLKLSRTYHAATNDTQPFTPRWLAAVVTVLDTMQDMQASTATYSGAYTFQRCSSCEPDTLWHGMGWPAARTGLIRTCFRPSDDAAVYPFNIPSNAMAVVELRFTAALLDTLGQGAVAGRARALAQTVDDAVRAEGVMARGGGILAFEVDGFGNQLFMDDSNTPSLLSLPYLGYLPATDPLYLRTRAAVLSDANPFFASGSAGNGTGGPHVGVGWLWPLSITMRAMTSTDDAEILMCLDMLRRSADSTGFMHESFWKDNVDSYTRPWFAWANSFFGELILSLAANKPHLIF